MTPTAPSPQAAPSPADVRWLLELAGSPGRPRERAATVVSGTALGLGALAAGVWLYDLALLLG